MWKFLIAFLNEIQAKLMLRKQVPPECFKLMMIWSTLANIEVISVINFQAFYDGFLSHEFKLPVDIRVKKLLITFSNLE